MGNLLSNIYQCIRRRGEVHLNADVRKLQLHCEDEAICTIACLMTRERSLCAPFEDAIEDEVFVFPTLFAQQQLWFLDQLAPGACFYNVPVTLRLIGALDNAALIKSFNEIVRRHEALRTTFD